MNKLQAPPSLPFHPFNPSKPVGRLTGNLPHWRQLGTTYFVTFRTADSLPQEKLNAWRDEQKVWLQANPKPWTEEQTEKYDALFSERIHRWLDQNYGACPLCAAAARSAVETTLGFFAGIRYRLGDHVVMPNHVHAIVAPLGGCVLSSIVQAWKSYTARQVNELLGRTGSLWQHEAFDHIIRSHEALGSIRRYIHGHPGARSGPTASVP